LRNKEENSNSNIGLLGNLSKQGWGKAREEENTYNHGWWMRVNWDEGERKREREICEKK